MDTPMTDAEVRDSLVPGEPGDDLLLRIIRTLRAETKVEVEEAGGVGPDQAVAVIHIDGQRMRITATPDS